MQEQDFVEFQCPHCSSVLSFLENQTGPIQQCPTCWQDVIVPPRGVGLGGRLPIPFRSGRLLLRRLQLTDEVDLLELMASEHSFRYIDWSPLDEAEVREWLRKDRVSSLAVPQGHLCLGLVLPETAKFIGFLDLCVDRETVGQAGFMIMIAPSYQKRGYGTEAVYAALGLAFKTINLRRIAVCVDSRNAAARRLLEKAGMRREGEFIKDWHLKGEWVNSVWYANLAEEFDSSK
jgi:RimJ/RimL family protein N-acetyltransferase